MGGWVCPELECSHSELMLDISCVGIVSAALGSVTPSSWRSGMEDMRWYEHSRSPYYAGVSVFVFLLYSSNGVIVSNFQDGCCGRDD